MQERYLGRIAPDMDVCDITGDKVGKISHVYRHADAAVSPSDQPSTPTLGERPPHDEVMEVKTGFLGLGSHLYIPLSAIQETLNDCVFISKSKEELEGLGWREKPAYLDELQ
jgi:hypothetical protein